MRYVSTILVLVVLVAVLLIGYKALAPQQSVAPATTKSAVIIGIADVYKLKGVNKGADGGLARVRALRADLEKTHPDLLLLLAGDFLSPSLEGVTYKGEQMIDLLNALDGDPRSGRFDNRMFAAFGNHEFDDSKCDKDDPVPLTDRVDQSEFTWLNANLDFNKCKPKGLRKLVGNRKITKHRIVTSGGLRIGLYGLVLKKERYELAYGDYMDNSCEQVAELRKKGVDVVVALTHLQESEDLKLVGLTKSNAVATVDRTQHPKCGPGTTPDLVIGGHEHHDKSIPIGNPKVFKAASDATTAQVITITKATNGTISIRHESKKMDQHQPVDPFVDRLADNWRTRHDEQFCAKVCIGESDKAKIKSCKKAIKDGACLEEPLLKTDSDIIAEELNNRGHETAFGNWLADQVATRGNADVALVNAGSMRLNENILAGATIRRRQIEELFPFPGNFGVYEVQGKYLWSAAQQAVNEKNEGPWLHMSGMAVKVDNDKVTDIVVRIRASGRYVRVKNDGSQKIKVAAVDFLLLGNDDHGNFFEDFPDPDPASKHPTPCKENAGISDAEKKEREQLCGAILKDHYRDWPEITVGGSTIEAESNPSRLVVDILETQSPSPLVLPEVDGRWCNFVGNTNCLINTSPWNI